MRIAVEGCAHGELEVIYNSIKELEQVEGKKVDLLICCGDFQSTRNLSDLKCMAVPEKYKEMCTFYKYYSGEKTAPILTIFIGGNHEASNYLQELPYGGWVAPNIYYLGYAGVITIGGIRIAGISGIYKSHDRMKGHFEKPPYSDSTIRSIYHVRNLEIYRLKQVSGKIDIFLSHDWPTGITKYGNENKLLKAKPYFRNDIENNTLGSPANMELLEHHHPSYWFSAHLHCKFSALIPEKEGGRITKFLALDKCLPKRKFLQILEIEHDASSPLELQYDLEWLTILYLTNHLLSVKSGLHYMPGQGGSGRWIYTPTPEEKEKILKKFNHSLQIPQNFTRTVESYNPDIVEKKVEAPQLLINDQTTQFCKTLGIDDPNALLQLLQNKNNKSTDTILETSFEQSFNSSEISTSMDEDNVFSSTLNETFSDTSFNKSPTNISPKRTRSEEELDLSELDKDASDGNISSADVSLVNSTFIDESPVQIPIEPMCKKFKRRNHSIYSNTL